MADLEKSTTAIAGLATGTSAAIAAAASLADPTGLSAAGVALGLTSAPLVVAAAPVAAGVAVAVGAVAGICKFCSWIKS